MKIVGRLPLGKDPAVLPSHFRVFVDGHAGHHVLGVDMLQRTSRAGCRHVIENTTCLVDMLQRTPRAGSTCYRGHHVLGRRVREDTTCWADMLQRTPRAGSTCYRGPLTARPVTAEVSLEDIFAGGTSILRDVLLAGHQYCGTYCWRDIILWDILLAAHVAGGTSYRWAFC